MSDFGMQLTSSMWVILLLSQVLNHTRVRVVFLLSNGIFSIIYQNFNKKSCHTLHECLLGSAKE